MSFWNGTRCCAKCRTPYGHSAEAGRCCHPSDAEVKQRELTEAVAASKPWEATRSGSDS